MKPRAIAEKWITVPENTTVPTIGRIVHYRLSLDDITTINRRRTTSASVSATPTLGNPVNMGDVFPMLITRCWGTTPESAVNGQVFLDGNDGVWVTSVMCGSGLGAFSWPTREASVSNA